jgi:hypothetical protein
MNISTGNTRIGPGSSLRIGYRPRGSALPFTYLDLVDSEDLPYTFVVADGDYEVQYSVVCPSCSISAYSGATLTIASPTSSTTSSTSTSTSTTTSTTTHTTTTSTSTTTTSTTTIPPTTTTSTTHTTTTTTTLPPTTTTSTTTTSTTTEAPLPLSDIGSLVVPLSSSIEAANLIYPKLQWLRTGKSFDQPNANSYQTFSNAGFKVMLTINHATSVSGAMKPYPTGSALTTYLGQLTTFLANNTAYFPIVCIQNEEGNQNYWDLSDPENAAARYLEMLDGAITRVHASGRKVSNGGVMGPALKWMVWKDIKDHQGDGAALEFAQKVFNSGEIAGLSGRPTNPTFSQTIRFLQVVIPAYATMNIDYINFHWYEPSHTDILGNTSIDPSVLLTIVQYLERVTGKTAITNELGQHNTAPNIIPQMLQVLTDLRMPYITLYDGDGPASPGTGEAYALHNSDNTLRPNGVAFNTFLDNYFPNH